MSLIGAVLGYILTVFLLLLIARLIVDWAEMLGNSPRWLWKVRRFTHSATEPVIAPVRRVLKPVRLGTVAFDLAFTVVFLAVLILRSVAFSL
ncbi:YggT family protein [Nocardia transvalensis]|uniref:YggT family protein n=1 Tax=Nocardia transvalensis TaxID=37333 RepID=A0A7W9PHN7_9NOCA|nr:YggT family protein [Nocardia transvalensis]MBB5915713.1 YggT family protein [Nocardia transvalensis]